MKLNEEWLSEVVLSQQKSAWHPERVGIAIGAAAGFAVLVLIAFRSHGFQLLLLFSFGSFGLISLAVSIFIGAGLGRMLAKLHFVPPLHPISVLSLVIGVALGPTAAGFVEVTMRAPAIRLPADAQNTQWERWPWGECVLNFESELEVIVLHNQMVQSAKENGWICRYCQYQPSTGTGHASFFTGSRSKNQVGRVGFEVWPGDKALYGMKPSELTQARVYSTQPTRSIEGTLFTLAAFLLVGMFRYSESRSAR